MTYPENLLLVELAEYYAKDKDERCLEELASRDKPKEPDNQMVFNFHKDLVSKPETTNNISVKDSDSWKEAYEIGFRAGAKHGLKIAQDITKIPGVSEDENY